MGFVLVAVSVGFAVALASEGRRLVVALLGCVRPRWQCPVRDQLCDLAGSMWLHLVRTGSVVSLVLQVLSWWVLCKCRLWFCRWWLIQ